ncbi:hypothetical protein HY489_03095 [Candidatus Woesearchaeota archaeon]|nr:hypothetical protein [Candidatus Woesearchaeota archaeon]
MSLDDILRNNILLDRVEILGESDEDFLVRHGDSQYRITKGAESGWSGGIAVPGIAIGIATRTEPTITPHSGAFQDASVPAEFREVMIFHELREREYVNHDFDPAEAHQRALNDEVLYVLKFFDLELQERYFEFAKQYRERKVEEVKPEVKEPHAAAKSVNQPAAPARLNQEHPIYMWGLHVEKNSQLVEVVANMHHVQLEETIKATKRSLCKAKFNAVEWGGSRESVEELVNVYFKGDSNIYLDPDEALCTKVSTLAQKNGVNVKCMNPLDYRPDQLAAALYNAVIREFDRSSK